MAKKIAELAKDNSDEALFVAVEGREYSDVKEPLGEYFDMKLKFMELDSKRLKPTKQDAVFFNLLTEHFLDMFWLALDTKDSSILRELADGIDSLKKRNPDLKADKLRADILAYKHLVTKQGFKPCTIAVLARSFKIPDKSNDGYSKLRKLCKQLGAPIAPSSRKLRDK